MIIDDDADDRMFFTEALMKIDPFFTAMEENCSLKALQFLRKTKQLPDYIFLDINMPLMNGPDCLNELKKDEKLKGIPVIMYSTSFTDKSIAELKGLGASACLVKPIDINSLPMQIFEAMN